MAAYSNSKDNLPEETLCIRLTETSKITGLWHLFTTLEEKDSKKKDSKKKHIFKFKITDSMYLQVISFSINIVVFTFLIFFWKLKQKFRTF